MLSPAHCVHPADQRRPSGRLSRGDFAFVRWRSWKEGEGRRPPAASASFCPTLGGFHPGGSCVIANTTSIIQEGIGIGIGVFEKDIVSDNLGEQLI